MRVLALTADLPPRVHSGIGTAVAWNAQAFAAEGGDVEVLTTAPAAVVPGVRVTYLSPCHFPTHLRGASLIHLHSLRLAELAFELRKRDGSALLYTAHALLQRELRNTPDSQLWQARQKRLFEEADHVAFLNDAERRWAVSLCPRVAARSTVLSHAVPPCSVVPHASETAPLVLFAGRFCRSKGLDVAVGAMEQMLRRRNRLRCALVGGSDEGGSNELVGALVARYPGRCVALGWLPHAELQTWLHRASLLMMPSRYEPFGMVALEGLRAGLPVLGARIDGLSTLLAEGSGAATLEGHNPGDWTEAALALLDAPERLRAMRLEGPPYVQRHYGPAAHAGVYRALLERCQAQRAAGSAYPGATLRAA